MKLLKKNISKQINKHPKRCKLLAALRMTDDDVNTSHKKLKVEHNKTQRQMTDEQTFNTEMRKKQLSLIPPTLSTIKKGEDRSVDVATAAAPAAAVSAGDDDGYDDYVAEQGNHDDDEDDDEFYDYVAEQDDQNEKAENERQQQDDGFYSAIWDTIKSNHLYATTQRLNIDSTDALRVKVAKTLLSKSGKQMSDDCEFSFSTLWYAEIHQYENDIHNTYEKYVEKIRTGAVLASDFLILHATAEALSTTIMVYSKFLGCCDWGWSIYEPFETRIIDDDKDEKVIDPTTIFIVCKDGLYYGSKPRIVIDLTE